MSLNHAAARRSFFITGTDTGVGKTFFSCALLHAAANAGYSTAAIKPVAAGAEPTGDGLRNDDALALQAACTLPLSYGEVNPFCLPAPVSPHLAAAEAGRRLQADRIVGFCQGVLMQRAAVTVVEGAGGWRVPINDNETLADVAKRLRLPVIMVVGVRLGCLNHAMLTAEAIGRDGLTLAGWVANTLDPAMPAREGNIAKLERELMAPMLADIPWLPSGNASEAAGLINLSALLPPPA